jgi:hypothetical protein
MMKEEFEKHSGLVLTDEEYRNVEVAYSMTDGASVDEFVPRWFRKGGYCAWLDGRAEKNRIKATIKKLETKISNLEFDLEIADRNRDMYRMEAHDSTEKLAAIGAAATEAVV